jgi:hypothetical protein
MTRRGQARVHSRRVTGPASDLPAPGIPGQPVPVTAHGPYPVTLAGFAGQAGAFGCAASVRTPSATLAAWASVAADGSGEVGWYTATWTTDHAAELEAIRWSLTRCPPAGSPGSATVIVTGSPRAAEAAAELTAGTWPLRPGFGNFPHTVLLAAARDECGSRSAAIMAVPGGEPPPGANACLTAARQLAWLTRRLATDGIPVDGDATAMLRSIVRGGRDLSRHRLSRLYGEWATGRRSSPGLDP